MSLVRVSIVPVRDTAFDLIDQSMLNSASLILTFIFGTVIGSFLNVVSLRFNTGVGVGGRSKCMNCNAVLSWKELIPLASFFMQGGSCRKCKSRISWQYPLVEFLAGAIFVLIFYVFPPTDAFAVFRTGVYLISTALLLVIVVYDVRHKIIPDTFVYAFAVIALISLFVDGSTWFAVPSYWELIAGPLLAVPFALLSLVSGGTWMGWGDSKLVLGIGWLLGISGGINAIILAFWIAAVVSVIWLLVKYKKFKSRTEIPFGPYLILGMYLSM